MDEIVLKAQKREVVGKKVKTLRQEGKLPAVIYGYEVEATPISLELREASRILANVSSSSLIKVELDGKEHSALVRDRQRDVILGTLLHVDFLSVSLTETVRAKVRVSIEGESPAISGYDALLVTGLEELEVECLPNDLPEQIKVDVSGLERVGDSIHVKDVKFPEGVLSLDDPETMVVVVTIPAAEPVEEEVEEEVEVEFEMPEEPELVAREEAEEDMEEEEV
jgi:large subunit ribosomal protein L25